MLNKIIQYSIYNKHIVFIGIFLLIIIGIINVKNLPIDAVPDITDNQVLIITSSPALSALDLERIVTIPIENSISNIKGIKNYRSFSRFGLSLVTIIFEDDIDIYWARQQVLERIGDVKKDIPIQFGTPYLAPISTGLGEIFQYTVLPKPGFEAKYSLTDLRSIQDWYIRKQLLNLKGIADVSSFGGKLKEYHVIVDPLLLSASGFSIQDVIKAIESNNSNSGSAYLEHNSTNYFIRSEGIIHTVSDIENITVLSSTNHQTLLKNIATVEIGHSIRYGAMIIDGREEATGGIVMMLKGENSNKVISNLKDKLSEIEKTLPPGIQIKPFLDRSKLVNNSIHTVFKNLIEGAIIVLIVLLFFLGNLRAGIIVASAIPLSMLIAIIMMNLFGVSGNLMSLGAIDFGIIIDGAVIIVESILFYIHTNSSINMNKNDIKEIVANNASKMMKSALFGQLIIIIVYLPLFALKGVEGKMFHPMLQTILFALFGAFILSLTYIPVMCATFLHLSKSSHVNFSDKVMNLISSKYSLLFNLLMKHAKITVITSIVLFLLSMVIFLRLGGEFMPIIAEGDFAVETRLLMGSSLSTTIENTKKASNILKSKYGEIEQIVTKIGCGEIPTDPMPIEAADMMIILKDKSEWTHASTYDELAEKMSKDLETILGVQFSFQYPVQMRFNELLSGAKQSVVCKLYGENLDSLSYYGALIEKNLNSCKGVDNIYLEQATGSSQIVINIDRSKLQNYQLSISDINEHILAFRGGYTVGKLYEDEKSYNIAVHYNLENKDAVIELQNSMVSTQNNLLIPLKEVAEIKVEEGANQIQRDRGKRRLIIGFDNKNRDVESLVNELNEKISKNIHFPPNYYIEFSGSFQNLQAAKQTLSIAVPIALLLIFVLLMVSIKNINYVIILSCIIPLSIIGGVFLLFIRGMPFSISAGVGFVALFGVSVLNGVVLVHELLSSISNPTDITSELMRTICIKRLRPILMTATVASLGFFPMAINTGLGYEIQRPLATVVIGGLITSTISTLLILPILLYKFKDYKGNFIQKIASKIMILLVILMPFRGKSQDTISLEKALDSVQKNSFTSKISIERQQMYKALLKKNGLLENTTIDGTYGQYNSSNNDILFSIKQSFSNPILYQNTSKFYQLQIEQSKIQQKLSTITLNQKVASLYVDYKIQKEKQDYYNKFNTLLLELEKKETSKFQKGDISQVELNLSKQFINKYKQLILENELTICDIIIEFNYLIGSTTDKVPDTSFDFIASYTLDSQSNTYLDLTKQASNLANSSSLIESKIAKNQLIPNVYLGYTNTSFVGPSIDNNLINYNIHNRFNTLLFGVNLNIFDAKTKQSIQKSTFNGKITKLEHEKLEIETKNSIQHLSHIIHTYREILDQYESNNQQQKIPLEFQIYEKMTRGDINYIEFVFYYQQLLDSKMNYLEAKRNYYNAFIQNYLLKK